MNRWVTEAIGTFLLVVIIGACVTGGAGAMTPIAVALGLSALVYMGGPISGAHYNPAVTLGFWAAGVTGRRDVLPYLFSEFVGAIAGALVVTLLMASDFVLAPSVSAPLGRAFAAELLFTFALMLVILNVAVPRAVAGNAYYGLAIGFTVGAGAFAVGGLSGAAFNPAVGLSPALVHLVRGGGVTAGVWIYLVAPVLGALLAVPVFRAQYPRGVAAPE